MIFKDVIEFQRAIPKAFAAYGTALGAYRENDIIKWDLDSDFYIHESDFNESVLEDAKKAGFKLVKKYGKDEGVQYVFYKRKKVDLWILYEGYYNCLWDGEPIRHEYPPEVIEVINVKLRDQTIRGLGEPYLTHVYGEWKTPVKKFDWRTDHKCAIG